MAGKRHTHKYQRVNLGYAGEVWACALKETGCTHHIPKAMGQDILNRPSICWECGNQFILGVLAIQEDKPRCNECRGDSELVHAVDDPFSSFVTGLKRPTKE